MKENQQVKPIIDVVARTVTFKYAGGLPDSVFHMDKAHQDNNTRAALTGYSQTRLVDAAAIPTLDEDGNAIPREQRVVMKRAAINELIEHYETGTPEWSRKGTGGGGFGSITIEAIARVKGTEYAEAEAMVKKYAEAKFGGDNKKALAFFRDSKTVREAMSAIKAERQSAPKIDADAALDELKS